MWHRFENPILETLFFKFMTYSDNLLIISCKLLSTGKSVCVRIQNKEAQVSQVQLVLLTMDRKPGSFWHWLIGGIWEMEFLMGWSNEWAGDWGCENLYIYVIQTFNIHPTLKKFYSVCSFLKLPQKKTVFISFRWFSTKSIFVAKEIFKHFYPIHGVCQM